MAREELADPVVSVVVPTFNRRSSLRRLLEGLTGQSYPPNLFEVIIVDDGSTDGSDELLRDLMLPYHLELVKQEHLGPAAARNLGVFSARGALIVFLDDDVVPSRNLISEHVATHSVMPDSVVIGPMSPPATTSPRPAWIHWEEEKLAVQYSAMLAGEYPCTPRQFYTGNASLPRARFLDSGGFDTSYSRAEDVELAYRLRDRGARFVFNPAADVTHHPLRTFEAWCRTPYQYGRYDVAMHRDKGREAGPCAVHEFHGRHFLTRTLVRFSVGRRPVTNAVLLALRGCLVLASQLRAQRGASFVLSATFNLLYWEGASDELGGRTPVLEALAESRRQLGVATA